MEVAASELAPKEKQLFHENRCSRLGRGAFLRISGFHENRCSRLGRGAFLRISGFGESLLQGELKLSQQSASCLFKASLPEA